MKKPSQDLFDLVKSLTPQEAKQFTRSLRLQESHAIKLLTHLRQAEAYDEGVIQQEVLPEMNANQFSVAKHYLYHQLLLFLVQRDQQAGAAWQIRTRLQSMEILFKRELFGQCDNLLNSIERSARQLDDPSLLKEVLLWRLKLADRQNHRVSASDFETLVQDFKDNADKDLALAKQQVSYHNFFYRLRKKGVLTTAEAIKNEFEPIFQHGLQGAAPHQSLASKLPYWHALATYAFMRGNFSDAYLAHRSIMQTMEQSPGWLALRPDLYLDSIFRVGLLYIEEARFEEAKLIVAKIGRLKHQDAQEGRRFFYRTQLTRALHTLQGDWRRLGQMIEDLEADFEGLNHRMSGSETAVFQFNNAMTFLILEEYAAAKRRLHDLLNSEILREHPDFEIVSKLLMLLIATQLRDQPLFQLWYRSLYRQLHKQSGAHPLEELMLKSLGKAFKAKTQAIKAEVWQALQQTMQQDAAASSRAIHYFDFLSWIRSRAEGCSFESVFRDKVIAEIAAKRAALS